MSLTAFYRVMVYLYYLYIKVLSLAMFKGLKAMLWCRVVLWENSKAGRVVLVLWAVGWFKGCG